MKKNIKTNDEIATAKLNARNLLLSRNEVPSITDMRKELGIDLANVLISNFDSITRKIMLIRDDNDTSKPPKVKMNIPIKTTHQDICIRGDKIEQKIITHMLKESLAEQLIILKNEFCEDLHRRENELYMEYDQLKQDVLANMKNLFESDEFEFISSQNEKRLKTADLIIKKFNEIKPLVLTAVAIRAQKLINKDHSRFLRQRCREQQRVYLKLRDIMLAESHAKNRKFMLRMLNDFGTSLSDQIQSIRSILLINNLYMILKDRLKFQTQVENLKEKLRLKLQCTVEKCEKLLTQPVITKDKCPNVELWKQKCLWLIDNYESFIESTTNKKKGYGRYFLDIERLMTNVESINKHDHNFYQCSYESGGILEYFNQAKKELITLPSNLPVITQEIHSKKSNTIPTKNSVTENIQPFIVKGCYDAKSEIATDMRLPQRVDSASSISSIEYNGHTYASLKSYNRIANKLYPHISDNDNNQITIQPKFHWGVRHIDMMGEEEQSAVDEVVEIAANFRQELLKALDLGELGKRIFNIIMESTSKITLPKSTSSIEDRRDEHGTMFIPPVPSTNSNELRVDSLNFLLEVENKFEKCINTIITPSAIIDFIRKIELAKTVKRRRIYRARDSVMLTEKKMKQNKLYNLNHPSSSADTIDIESNEPQEDDYNPPLYFHQNCLNFHYVFDSYLDKINSMIADDDEIPDDIKIELEGGMRARAQLNIVDLVKQHLRNTRVLRKLSQKPKLLSHGILRCQNHFKTREKIDEQISKMKLDKLLEIVDKVIIK